MPFIPIDDEMVEKIRFIAERRGRDLSRALREAIDAAYDLELQERGGELQAAAFMHAIDEDDPVNWEEARRALDDMALDLDALERAGQADAHCRRDFEALVAAHDAAEPAGFDPLDPFVPIMQP